MKQNLSSPEGVACVPATCPVFLCTREAGHDGKHVSINGTAWHVFPETVAAPSPAESVPLGGPEAIRPRVSGLATSSADVPPVAVKTRYFASSLMGAPGEYTVDIMREVTTESTTTTGLYAALECTRLPFELQREADRLVELLNGGAAHLAKIQALSEALRGLLENGPDCFRPAETGIGEYAEKAPVDGCDCRNCVSVRAAREALASAQS